MIDRFDMPVFQLIGESIENISRIFLMPTASNIISGFQTTLIIGITIYIMLNAFSVLTGSSDQPLSKLFKQCAKLMCIAAVVTSADSYSKYVVDFINGLEEGLCQLISNKPGLDIYAMLDDHLAQAVNKANECFNNIGLLGILNILDVKTRGWIVLGIGCLSGIGIVALIGGTVLVIAKTWMIILLAIGPIFIACLMFPITSRLFDGWLSQILNTVITIVLMNTVLVFGIKILTQFIDQVDPQHWTGDRNPFFSGLQILFAGLVISFILYQVPRYASALGGGVAMGLIGLRQMTSVVTAPARVATSAGRMAAGAIGGGTKAAGGTITRAGGGSANDGRPLPKMDYNRHLMESLRKQSA